MTNEEAIKEIQRWIDGCPFEDTKEAFTLAIKALEKRPQGEWIGDTDYESYQGCYEAYKCNKCGYGLHWRDYYNSDVSKNFCPECGADMRKGGAE